MRCFFVVSLTGLLFIHLWLPIFLSEDHFAKVDRLVRKTFYFCKFGDIHVEKENKKSESTRDQYENAKVT